MVLLLAASGCFVHSCLLYLEVRVLDLVVLKLGRVVAYIIDLVKLLELISGFALVSWLLGLHWVLSLHKLFHKRQSGVVESRIDSFILLFYRFLLQDLLGLLVVI